MQRDNHLTNGYLGVKYLRRPIHHDNLSYGTEIIRRGIDWSFSINLVKEIWHCSVPFTGTHISKNCRSHAAKFLITLLESAETSRLRIPHPPEYRTNLLPSCASTSLKPNEQTTGISPRLWTDFSSNLIVIWHSVASLPLSFHRGV